MKGGSPEPAPGRVVVSAYTATFYDHSTGDRGHVAFYFFVLAFGTVGALIWARRSRKSDCALAERSGFAQAAAAVAGEYGHYSVAEAGAALFGTSAALWLSTWAWSVGATLAATFALLLFPTGRLPSRRWRPAAWLAGFGLMMVAATIALRPGLIDDFRAIDNPVGGAAGFLGLIGAGKYNAALTIEKLRARSRDEIDLDSLTDHLIQVVRGTMEPVQVWLKAPEDTIDRKRSPAWRHCPQWKGDPF